MFHSDLLVTDVHSLLNNKHSEPVSVLQGDLMKSFSSSAVSISAVTFSTRTNHQSLHSQTHLNTLYVSVFTPRWWHQIHHSAWKGTLLLLTCLPSFLELDERFNAKTQSFRDSWMFRGFKDDKCPSTFKPKETSFLFNVIIFHFLTQFHFVWQIPS